ncbi:MAG: MerR family transcriptional regulator [Spirochaetia bacterium]
MTLERDEMRYKIGEFSQLTRLPVKTLRFYHDEGILVPARIDTFTGYRFYDETQLERARVIVKLRALEFSIPEIKQILETAEDDENLVEHVQRKAGEVEEKVRKYQALQNELSLILKSQQEVIMTNKSKGIETKEYGETLAASIRYTGKYSDVGKYIPKIYKACGGAAAGAPFNLYYDKEYKDNDADIEICVPIRKMVKSDAVTCRVIPAQKYYTLIHQGPYEELSYSYKKMFDYLAEKGEELQIPIRETYIKGPGMIFRGNPNKYITEIAVPVSGQERGDV